MPDSSDPRAPLTPLPAGAPRAMRFAPAYLGRPGPVSAVGGLGIVAGIIGIITSLALFAVAGGLISVSASSVASAKQFAPQAMPVSTPDQPIMISTPFAPPEPGPQGLATADRQILVTLLLRAIELSPEQQQQLDVLLREAGKRVFPGTLPASDAAMASALLDRGTMQSASSEAARTVFFVTAGGRAEIYDDRAVFHPADASDTVRTKAGPHLNATNHPILRQEDVDALIKLVRDASGGKLNPPQTQTLANLLRSPDQQLVCLSGPGDSQTIGITGAGAQPGGLLLVGFAGGPLLLTQSGQPLFKGDALPGVSIIACIAMMIMALVGFGLALRLVVLSRRLLKQTLLTPRFHRRWAMMKIATAIVSAVLFGWMIDSFAASRPGADASALTGIEAGIALGAAGLVFPALVFVMFKKRSARLYFDGVM
ncbi:MAG TPA: hypothetical protein VFE47_04405 [Tepidisphaeraceae bacterium]|nr:hypothetical protein [Tepidisphaeraceae bacterium]